MFDRLKKFQFLTFRYRTSDNCPEIEISGSSTSKNPCVLPWLESRGLLRIFGDRNS